MSKQDEFDDAAREANIASCDDGQPHVFIERMKWLDRGRTWLIGECDRCGELNRSWYDINDPPMKITTGGEVS